LPWRLVREPFWHQEESSDDSLPEQFPHCRCQFIEAAKMPHLLVVDDSGVDRQIAGSLLEKRPEWTVAYACDGIGALEQIKSRLPDLIVTDLMMPGLNGLELVEFVHANHPGIPVVLMTGVGSEEIALEAFHKGAASYVPKKELVVDLVDTVARLLAMAPQQQFLNRLQNGESEMCCDLENDLISLSSFTQELRQTIGERGLFNDSECLRFATAVDEALMNAYFHGNLEIDSKLREEDGNAYHDLAQERRRIHPYCDRRIHVRARIDAKEVAVTVRDDGSGFDFKSLPDPTDPDYLDRPYGRGMLLMRTFADAVRFNDSGNEVTLVKWTE
jgi:CheY-like chemotaxis protein/anti-sigma regulatory factor (Ser/Thr protein kinase)